MAEFQLALVYDSKPQKMGFMSSLFFVPVWTMIAPFVLGCLLTYLIRFPDNLAKVNTLILLAVLFGFIFVIVGGFLLTAYLEDNLLFVTNAGINFQPLFAPTLKMRRRRNWDELKRVFISGEAGQETLSLLYADGGLAALRISCMKEAELEQFLMAVEAFARKAEIDAEVRTFQTNLQNKTKGLLGVSYTQLWDDELSRRFHSTSFVPLEPDATLRKGQLKIIRQLAFGGFSAIYLAQMDGLDMVVLKEAVVPASADPVTKEQAIRYLEKESAMLCALQHPNIAVVKDFFVEDERHYLLLEYINGADLRQFVKQNGVVSSTQVLNWSIDMAEILAYLHGQNPPIIHRDLTPDNIVLQNDGGIKLIDFGAANEFLGTATGTLIGKQAYIAPEQLRGKATLASDLYSLGGTMHFLLTAQEPVPLSVSRPLEINDKLDKDLSQIIEKLTAYEETERFTSADALKEELVSLKLHKGVAAHD